MIRPTEVGLITMIAGRLLFRQARRGRPWAKALKGRARGRAVRALVVRAYLAALLPLTTFGALRPWMVRLFWPV